MYNLENPLYLLLIFPLIYVFLPNKKVKSILIPTTKTLSKKRVNKRIYIGKILMFLSFFLMLIALSKPQKLEEEVKVKRDGIDISIVLDISRSMLASDIKPNRLARAKDVITTFVKERSNDRISLVVFAGNAYTRVPLTFDQDVIVKSIKDLGVGDISDNKSTAIGLGMGVGLNRLKNSESKSKVMILLTDGENNAGTLSPRNSAQLAKDLGVKVYTIGIGGEYVEVQSFFGRTKVENTEIDEELLNEIAAMTDGKYYRAKDSDSFYEIFKDIDQLEKSKIEGRQIQKRQELYRYFLIPSIFLMILGMYFDRYKYVVIP